MKVVREKKFVETEILRTKEAVKALSKKIQS